MSRHDNLLIKAAHVRPLARCYESIGSLTGHTNKSKSATDRSIIALYTSALINPVSWVLSSRGILKPFKWMKRSDHATERRSQSRALQDSNRHRWMISKGRYLQFCGDQSQFRNGQSVQVKCDYVTMVIGIFERLSEMPQCLCLVGEIWHWAARKVNVQVSVNLGSYKMVTSINVVNEF